MGPRVVHVYILLDVQAHYEKATTTKIQTNKQTNHWIVAKWWINCWCSSLMYRNLSWWDWHLLLLLWMLLLPRFFLTNSQILTEWSPWKTNKSVPVENQCHLSGSLRTHGSGFRSTCSWFTLICLLSHVSFCWKTTTFSEFPMMRET